MKQVLLLLIPVSILFLIIYVEGRVGIAYEHIHRIYNTIDYIESEGRELEIQLDEILIRNDLGSLDSLLRYPVNEYSIMMKRESRENIEILTGQRSSYSDDVKIFKEKMLDY